MVIIKLVILGILISWWLRNLLNKFFLMIDKLEWNDYICPKCFTFWTTLITSFLYLNTIINPIYFTMLMTALISSYIINKNEQLKDD